MLAEDLLVQDKISYTSEFDSGLVGDKIRDIERIEDWISGVEDTFNSGKK